MVSSVSVFAVSALAPNDLGGHVATIREIVHERKCRLALDLIASRYAASRGRACA